MSDKKSTVKSYLISIGMATAVLMVGIYPEWFAEYGLVESFIKFLVWTIFLVGFLAIGVLGVGTGLLLWYQDEFTSYTFDEDMEKINIFLDQFNEIKPTMWRSLPVTLYWLTAFVFANKATGDWGITGITYLFFSLLSWVVIFGFAKGMNNLADRLREKHENMQL